MKAVMVVYAHVGVGLLISQQLGMINGEGFYASSVLSRYLNIVIIVLSLPNNSASYRLALCSHPHGYE